MGKILELADCVRGFYTIISDEINWNCGASSPIWNLVKGFLHRNCFAQEDRNSFEVIKNRLKFHSVLFFCFILNEQMCDERQIRRANSIKYA